MNLVNRARLVSLNLHEKRKLAVQTLSTNFKTNLTTLVGGLVLAATNSNAIDTKVNSNVLNEIYRIDVERILDGAQISEKAILGDIDMKQQQDLAVTSLDMDFDGQLDQAVTNLMNGIHTDNRVSMLTWSKVLKEKFQVGTEEILSPVEQNRLSSLLASNH